MLKTKEQSRFLQEEHFFLSREIIFFPNERERKSGRGLFFGSFLLTQQLFVQAAKDGTLISLIKLNSSMQTLKDPRSSSAVCSSDLAKLAHWQNMLKKTTLCIY